ncbi:MAG: hypothetical protein RL015_1282 [Verrucomicrobiota bacterium]
MAKMRQGIKLPTKEQIAYVVTAICQPRSVNCPRAVIETMPRIPTLWDFQQRLKAEGREGGRKLFDAFVQMLEGRGIVAREGSIVDASFVDAPRQHNDRDTNQRVKKGKPPEEFDTHPTGVARKTAKHIGSRRTA